MMPIMPELGMHPKLYGSAIVNGLQIKQAPVDEQQVADFLGYDISEITSADIEVHPGLSEVLELSPAHLLRGLNRILIKGGLPRPIKRVCVFHEFGHEALPWHTALDFGCSENPIQPHFHKSIEKEAFQCGSEILMPSLLFESDLRSLPTSINSIRTLAQKYDASLESTAIRYAELHPEPCAVVIAEPPTSKLQSNAGKSASTPLGLNLEAGMGSSPIGPEFPLKVKYGVCSRKFECFFHPGSGIGVNNPIYEAWKSRNRAEGRVTGSTFSLGGSWGCHAECLPLLSGKMLLTLLWEPDKQSRLIARNGGVS